jgi:Fic family protein
MPSKPPNHRELLAKSPDLLATAFASLDRLPDTGRVYPHWDQLRRLPLPQGLTHESWWTITKISREMASRSLPMNDKRGSNFRFILPDAIHQQLHEIDRKVGGMIAVPQEVVNQQTRDQYLISSLINEAITSSQLEGAVTTRAVAKEMIRTGRSPRDKSERMILNNYHTMGKIIELQKQPLTKDLVFELHRMVTEGRLENNAAAGRFRTASEKIRVEDQYGEVFHEPPPAKELEDRMAAMCHFANGTSPNFYIHPVVRAILLHLWLAYDHPFVDGNGRTARALFYWSMLHSGYWLFEFVSISDIILQSPKAYYLAFLYSETDENDATYFIVHQLDVIKRGIKSLYSYIARKTAETNESEKLLRDWALALNHRQLALVSHALRHPETIYTVEAHRNSHSTVYETARRDLLDLVEMGFLMKAKRGRTMVFRRSPNLSRRIKKGVPADPPLSTGA